MPQMAVPTSTLPTRPLVMFALPITAAARPSFPRPRYAFGWKLPEPPGFNVFRCAPKPCAIVGAPGVVLPNVVAAGRPRGPRR